MAEPRILILRAAGTNCDEETAFAFEQAGASATAVHVNRLLEKPDILGDYGMVAIPGGFSYGDDVAAGRILGLELGQVLGDALRGLVARGGLVLGICNGFQVLVQSGLLPGGDGPGGEPVRASLGWNDSHRYEDRWVWLDVDAGRCVLAPKDGRRLHLPIAHAEGRFTLDVPERAAWLGENQRVVFRYVTETGAEAGYPDNPNGSDAGIAGICDETGQVLGLMPHPERAILPFHHPRWTREAPRKVGDGHALFEAAVQTLRG